MRTALISLSLAALCACKPSSAPAPVTELREPRVVMDASALDADDAASDRPSPTDSAAEDSEASLSQPNAAPRPVSSVRGLENDCPREPGRAAIPALVMPAMPPELASEVRRLRPFVARSMQCFETALRFVHVREPNCAPSLDELSRAGLAGVYAIAQFGVDEQAERLAPLDAQDRISRSEHALMISRIRNVTTNEVEPGTGSMLLFSNSIGAVLARSQRTEAAGALLAILDRHMRCQSLADDPLLVLIRPWLDQLAQLVGFDVSPQAPWTLYDEEASEQSGRFDPERTDPRRAEQAALNYRAYRAWALWYAAHRTESYAQWQSIALERNRRALTSRSAAERVSAIERLSAATASREDRDAAMSSLQDLLANGGLSAAGRRYLRGRFGAQLADASAPSDAALDSAVDAR